MSCHDDDVVIAQAPAIARSTTRMPLNVNEPEDVHHHQHQQQQHQQQQQQQQQRAGLSDKDLTHWKHELDGFLAQPRETLRSRSADDAHPWATSLFGCFCRPRLCLVSFCCPCVVFGKTHHRVNRSSDMEGYEPVNTSCLLYLCTGLFGIQWIFEALQRAQMRRKYRLEGSCMGDLARSCCCSCCLASQLEKESEHREKVSTGSGGAQSQEQYRANEDMVYPGGEVLSS